MPPCLKKYLVTINLEIRKLIFYWALSLEIQITIEQHKPASLSVLLQDNQFAVVHMSCSFSIIAIYIESFQYLISDIVHVR